MFFYDLICSPFFLTCWPVLLFFICSSSFAHVCTSVNFDADPACFMVSPYSASLDFLLLFCFFFSFDWLAFTFSVLHARNPKKAILLWSSCINVILAFTWKQCTFITSWAKQFRKWQVLWRYIPEKHIWSLEFNGLGIPDFPSTVGAAFP